MAFILIFGGIAIFLAGTYAGVVAVASLASHFEDWAHSIRTGVRARLIRRARILNGLYVRMP